MKKIPRNVICFLLWFSLTTAIIIASSGPCLSWKVYICPKAYYIVIMFIIALLYNNNLTINENDI